MNYIIISFLITCHSYCYTLLWRNDSLSILFWLVVSHDKYQSIKLKILRDPKEKPCEEMMSFVYCT